MFRRSPMASAPALGSTTARPQQPAAVSPPRGPRLPMLLQSYLALQWLVPYGRWAQRRYGEVIMRTVFGAGDSPQLAELRKVLGTITHVTFVRSLWYVAPVLGLVPPWRGYARAIRRANELLSELIAARRAAPNLEDRDDVLSLPIRSGDGDEAWRPDQVVNLLAAG